MECVRLFDEASGLDGAIAIHSTARGPAAGGCRIWAYPNLDAALRDAFLLAEGMSYKNAMARLPLGGGKAVLRRPPGAFDRQKLFEAFGRAVEKLDGRYVTAEDVGTGVGDMEIVARFTSHVAGRTALPGRAGGDPSPWTALGVYEAMKASAQFQYNSFLAGMTVSVLGIGNVGGALCRLLASAGARLVIADVDPVRARAVAEETGASVVGISAISAVDAEVFAPCALGGSLDADCVSALRARVVCGAANNQLAAPEIADQLRARGIVYAPDYVVNAGGIINVAAEYLGESEAEVRDRVLAIGPRTRELLERAADEGLTTSTAADREAETLIKHPEVVLA
jgi:leucine dehydrogenase